MSQRIKEDHDDFRGVVSGRIHKRLKQFVGTGHLFRLREKGGKISLTIPKINLPHIVFGNPQQGVGRGPGEKGKVVGKDKAGGKANGAGADPGEGITVQIELEEILKFLKEELKLPNLLPKPSDTYEEIKKRYTNISRTGPKSLRHMRRTLQQCMRRLAASGELDKKVLLPGYIEPLPELTLIGDDIRYRQFNEYKIPSSNAVIFFARDGSGSMDQYRCDIVSDMAYWIDLWIRSFYKRTDRVYIWHDTEAQEVGPDKFYNYRYGGGTFCSSAMNLISQLIKHKYPPEKYNIYVFYFTDGDNWDEDNEKFINTLAKDLNPELVNFIGITQILSYHYQNSLKQHVDKAIADGVLNKKHVKTTSVSQKDDKNQSPYYWNRPAMSDEERDEAIKNAIKELIGSENKEGSVVVEHGAEAVA